jgi:hypothetical protein
VASHLIVGGLLRLAMSAGAGPAFAIALAVLIRAGLRALDNPLSYVRGEAAGGALLYLIMMEGVAPHLNRTIVEVHPATTVLPRSPRLRGRGRGPRVLAHRERPRATDGSIPGVALPLPDHTAVSGGANPSGWPVFWSGERTI